MPMKTPWELPSQNAVIAFLTVEHVDIFLYSTPLRAHRDILKKCKQRDTSSFWYVGSDLPIASFVIHIVLNMLTLQVT